MPPEGMSKEAVLAALESLRTQDADWRQGRMFGLIYNAGDDVEDMARSAYSAFLFQNALSPFAFPSLLRMETEFVSMLTTLCGGDDETVGAMTSGGTESIFMALKAARDWARAHRPEVSAPEMVVPITIHPAWNKAAHYLGLKILQTPVRDDCRADMDALRAAVTDNTIILGGSAVSYPHGVVDPIDDLGRLALEKNCWLHVDACLGGFILPFLKKLGHDIPPYDFQVPGVKSMSVDVHKYGYISKGGSTALYRNAELREYQFFVYTDWPGGIYATPSMSGARPGGTIASAWAMMHYLGQAGFMERADRAVTAAKRLQEGINALPDLFVLGSPPATVFSFGSRTINIFELGAKMKERGWHMDAQHMPASLHMTVSPVHETIVDDLLADLKEAVRETEAVRPGEESEDAALYGMMGTMPDRKAAKEFALKYLGELYRLKS